MNIPLEQPWFLLLIPLGVLAVWRLVRQHGGIGFSTATLLEGMRVGTVLIILERFFLAVFIVASAVILARPTAVVKNSVPVYKEARDIVIVLDVSGSMNERGKIAVAKKVIADFVEGRPQDRFSLFSFENRAHMEWPLSVDHQALLSRLKTVTGGGGTTISSGIVAGLQHQKQFGQSRGAVIVVSDGISDVTPEERQAIESSLGKTRLYWIWIGEKSDKLAIEFREYVVQNLGGKVYAGTAGDLEEIFSEISALEASPVVWEQHVSTVYRFGVLPLAALLGLLAAAVVEQLREV